MELENQFQEVLAEVLPELIEETQDAGQEQEWFTLPIAQLAPPPQGSVVQSSITQGSIAQGELNQEFVPYDDCIRNHRAADFAQRIAHHQQGWNLQSRIKAYAEVICVWLSEQCKQSNVVFSKPVYLLEAEATTGEFGLSLIKVLREKMPEYGLQQIQLCYLFALSCAEHQAQLENNPLFQTFARESCAKITPWNMLQNHREIPTHDTLGEPLSWKENPAVFIANGVLSQLPQQLLYVHYSHLYSASVHYQKNADSTQALEYQWRKTSAQEIAGSYFGPLQLEVENALKQALSQSQCKALFFPKAAIELQAQLQQQCSKGILCIQSDDAVLQQDALTTFDVPLLLSTKPVFNFDLIYALQDSLKGENLLNAQSHLSGKAINIATFNSKECVNEPQKVNEALKACIRQNFSQSCPQSTGIIVQIAKQMAEQRTQPFHSEEYVESLPKSTQSEHSLEKQMLFLLTNSAFEPKVLEAFLPQLLQQGVSAHMRLHWCEALSQVWRAFTMVQANGNFAFQLGLLAMDLSHWQLAKYCFTALLQQSSSDVACLYNLSLTAFSIHDLALARRNIHQALVLAPEDEQCQQLTKSIQAYEQRIKNLVWYQPYRRESCSIALVPLDEHHLSEFFIQYRDPNIAQRLRSVEIESPYVLHQLCQQWKEEGDQNARMNYAAIHAQYGFVGSVVLDWETETQPCLDDRKSHIISFWIGTDYQGKGFANAMLQQALWQAEKLAEKGLIQTLETSAWCHNLTSQKVLLNNGFEKVPSPQSEKAANGKREEKKQFQEVFFRRML